MTSRPTPAPLEDVRRALSSGGPINAKMLAKALARFRADPAELLREVRAFLQGNEDAASGVARRSQLHPIGFWKLVLISSREPTFSLRLHVWSRPVHEVSLDVHTHRWDFASLICAGAFVQDIYESECRSGIEVRRFYWTDDCEGREPRSDRRTAFLRLSSSTQPGPGSIYELRAGVPHCFRPIRSGVSLVLQGPSVSEASQIFRRTDQQHLSTPGRTGLSTQEVQEALDTALSLCSRG